jgi:hypothetical protein
MGTFNDNVVRRWKTCEVPSTISLAKALV